MCLTKQLHRLSLFKIEAIETVIITADMYQAKDSLALYLC